MIRIRTEIYNDQNEDRVLYGNHGINTTKEWPYYVSYYRDNALHAEYHVWAAHDANLLGLLLVSRSPIDHVKVKP